MGVEGHSHQDEQRGGQLKTQIALRDVTAIAADLELLSGAAAAGLSAAELLTLNGVTSVVGELNSLDDAPVGATFIIGAEATNVINVAVQLRNGVPADLAQIGHVKAYLSDAATGVGISAAAPSAGVAIGTNGSIIVSDAANLALQVQSNATGDFDIDITEVGVATWYLVIVLPNGKQVVSTAITFA